MAPIQPYYANWKCWGSSAFTIAMVRTAKFLEADHVSHISNPEIRKENITYCVDPLDTLLDEPSHHEVPSHM